MRFHAYFNTAIKIIRSYNGSIPFSHFLKKYFSENKKHGSGDRKLIAHACYNYFRLGSALKHISIEERLRTAIFLCNETAGGWNILYEEAWLQNWDNSLDKRIAFVLSVYDNFFLNDVFPFTNQLSEGIDISTFVKSHFIQPDLFLRIRPHHQHQVISMLQKNDISFSQPAGDCIQLPAATNAEKLFKIDEEVVVQDHSSQQIKNYLQLAYPGEANRKSEIENLKSVWDCCAGSGGKSILAYDTLENIQLAVTDVRSSIIHNLNKRFQKAGIKNYKSWILDVTKPLSKPFALESEENFDLILCDVPCTGSGTWSRAPEQLCFFQAEKINEYAARQEQIVKNATSLLKPNGYFLYITCSVFKKENEEIAAFVKNSLHFRLMRMELLKGYDKKADTMFAALFQF